MLHGSPAYTSYEEISFAFAALGPGRRDAVVTNTAPDCRLAWHSFVNVRRVTG